jgi:hypothetical protein
VKPAAAGLVEGLVEQPRGVRVGGREAGGVVEVGQQLALGQRLVAVGVGPVEAQAVAREDVEGPARVAVAGELPLSSTGWTLQR